MVNKDVGPEKIKELFGDQMVSYYAKANPGRDSACSSEGAKQRGLGNAEAFPASQDVAGLVVFRKIKGSIRIVTNSIANREIKLNGFFHGIVTTSRHPMCIIANDGVVAVYDRCWSKKILHVRQTPKDQLIFRAYRGLKACLTAISLLFQPCSHNG